MQSVPLIKAGWLMTPFEPAPPKPSLTHTTLRLFLSIPATLPAANWEQEFPTCPTPLLKKDILNVSLCMPTEKVMAQALEGAAGTERNPLFPSAKPALELMVWGQANASTQESRCS